MANSLRANPKLANMNGWQDRHNEATFAPNRNEQGIVHMLKGWAKHAEEHEVRYNAPIGEDGVLGDHWKDIGLGIRGLLNGELGRLDAGTLDGFILNTLAENGINTENL